VSPVLRRESWSKFCSDGGGKTKEPRVSGQLLFSVLRPKYPKQAMVVSLLRIKQE